MCQEMMPQLCENRRLLKSVGISLLGTTIYPSPFHFSALMFFRLAGFLHLRLHFHDFLAILPITILLTIPVELLAVSVAVAKHSAPATLLARRATQLSPAPAAIVADIAHSIPTRIYSPDNPSRASRRI